MHYFAVDDEDDFDRAAELRDLEEDKHDDDDLPTMTSGTMNNKNNNNNSNSNNNNNSNTPMKTTAQIKEDLFSISDNLEEEEEPTTTTSTSPKAGEDKLISLP